ncbi:MAG: TonB-dependent receptor [Vicinamibacterales bacterium]
MPIISLLLSFILSASVARPITITGDVTTDRPKGPVDGAIVSVGGLSTTTDAKGAFSLPIDAADGEVVHLLVVKPGYHDFTIDLTIRNDLSVSVTLSRRTFEEEVVVSGRAANIATAAPAIELTPITVSRVAGAGDNVYRVLQTLPGVSAADDFGSRLAVRGGGPDQNLTMMDGVEIHNPYRLFGLTSAFNPDTIERFELTAGGFSAKYGDRLSSILLVDNRIGNSASRVTGSAALSATDTNLVLEGGFPSGSWLVSGRRTYYDLVAERVTDNDLPSFGDLQTKVSWEPRVGQRLTLTGVTSRESTDATFNDSGSGDRIGLIDHSRNDVGALTYSAVLGTRATATTTLAAYRYRDDLGVDGTVRNDSTRSNAANDDTAFPPAAIVFTRGLGVRDLSARESIRVVVTPKQTLDFGAEYHALRTDWGWMITGDRNDSVANGSSVLGGAGLPSNLVSTAKSSRAALFAEDEIQLRPSLSVAAGARLDWSQLSGEHLLSPRARATITLSPRTKLKAAGGLFTQSPGYEKLLQSDYFVDLSNSQGLGLQSERSVHAIGGWEQTLTDATTIRVEAYHKTFDRMMAGRLETPAETALRVAQYDYPTSLTSQVPTAPQITSVPNNNASGRSYGVDLFLEKRQLGARDRVTGWVSYTLGKATLDNYDQSYPFDYDRRHSLSIVSTWRFIPRVDLGATLRVASGFPASTPVGIRVASVLKDGATPGAPKSLVPRTDANGLLMWTADFGGVENLNRSRLPLYARLDLRFTYIRRPTSRWQFYLEAINALNRKNASSLTPKLVFDPGADRPGLTLSRDGGLPFFPSGGFRWRF